MSGPGDVVTMVDPHGGLHDVPIDHVADAEVAGFHRETGGEETSRLAGEVETDPLRAHPVTSKALAGVFGVARGATLGLSDVGIAATGGQRFASDLKQYAPTISAGSEILGALATAIPTGGSSLLDALPGRAAAKLGAHVAEAGEGAGALTKVVRAAGGGAVEGGIYGLGAGTSELALSDEPLTLEHAASVLSSNMLYGAATGGVLGGAGKGVELGLGRAKTAIDGFIANREAAQAIPDDLSQLDAKGLKAARDVEVEKIKAVQQSEIDTATAARATDRKAVADEINTFRRETKQLQHSLTTKDVDVESVGDRWGSREIGKVAIDADRQLDRILNNPIALAESPAKANAALGALQQQENVYTKLLEREPEMRAAYGTGELAVKRNIALDSIPQTLERNRALQARIKGLAEPIEAKTANVSPRLTQIDEAREMLSGGRGDKTLAEQMVQGGIYGAVHGAVASIPILGPIAAPFIGAKASRLVTDQVFGRLGKAAAESQLRMAKSVSTFLEPARKSVKAAIPLATRTLAAVRYAPPAPAQAAAPAVKGDSKLAQLYRARTDEVRSQMAAGPNGQPMMHPAARAQVADRLKGIAAVDPVAADRFETVAARKLELLAAAMPKRPDIMANANGGPDMWKPSDMAMRKWARLAAAVEDPAGVIDRLAAGHVTPDDVLAMRTVYPEIHRSITQQVMEKLPTLRATLPYNRRLALSIFTGQPVDPSMAPNVLRVLQGTFAAETGTQGGTAPQMPKPNFGALGTASKTAFAGDPTAAQKRAG